MEKTPQSMTDAEYHAHLEEVFGKQDIDKLARKERRKCMVEYNDKPIPVYKYFKILASELPPCTTKDGVPYDHERMLRQWFKDAGLTGVKEYVSIVRGAAKFALGYGEEDDTNRFIRGKSPEEEDKLQEEGGQQREGLRSGTSTMDRS